MNRIPHTTDRDIAAIRADFRNGIAAAKDRLESAQGRGDTNAIARESAAVLVLTDYLADFEKEHKA